MLKYIAIIAILLTAKFSFSQVLLPANMNTLDSVKKANMGNVVLINFWATWCKPCVEEFPDLIKLNNEYKDKNFKIVFVSLDFGHDLEDKTKTFLKKQGVDFATYYNNFERDEDIINYMDKNWDGGIPGTFIFDKDGKLRKTFVGKRKYEDFKNAVDESLAAEYIKP